MNAISQLKLFTASRKKRLFLCIILLLCVGWWSSREYQISCKRKHIADKIVSSGGVVLSLKPEPVSPVVKILKPKSNQSILFRVLNSLTGARLGYRLYSIAYGKDASLEDFYLLRKLPEVTELIFLEISVDRTTLLPFDNSPKVDSVAFYGCTFGSEPFSSSTLLARTKFLEINPKRVHEEVNSDLQILLPPLHKLQCLSVNGGSLDFETLKLIPNPTEVLGFDFAGTQCEGDIKVLLRFKNLKALSFDYTNIDLKSLEFLGALKQLEFISLLKEDEDSQQIEIDVLSSSLGTRVEIRTALEEPDPDRGSGVFVPVD